MDSPQKLVNFQQILPPIAHFTDGSVADKISIRLVRKTIFTLNFLMRFVRHKNELILTLTQSLKTDKNN